MGYLTFVAIVLYWVTKNQWWMYVGAVAFLIWCWRTK